MQADIPTLVLAYRTKIEAGRAARSHETESFLHAGSVQEERLRKIRELRTGLTDEQILALVRYRQILDLYAHNIALYLRMESEDREPYKEQLRETFSTVCAGLRNTNVDRLLWEDEVADSLRMNVLGYRSVALLPFDLPQWAQSFVDDLETGVRP
ncbi:hypothetical protein M1555_00015 [Patescibacteria group bacterium]|nr:hypothetical protein [Patescibacteria group bacterium]